MDDERGVSLRRFLQLAALAVAVFLGLRLFVFEAIVIATGSMEPTLPVGTHAFLDKLTYRFRSPRRGEIIVFVSPLPPKEELTKRVIGLPGDSIELREKKLTVNGAELQEHYVIHNRAEERLTGDNLSYQVPRRCLFVLGDNRDESSDSSVWKDPQTGAAAPCLPLRNVRGIVRGFF